MTRALLSIHSIIDLEVQKSDSFHIGFRVVFLCFGNQSWLFLRETIWLFPGE